MSLRLLHENFLSNSMFYHHHSLQYSVDHCCLLQQKQSIMYIYIYMYISNSNKYATYNPYQPWHPPSLPDPLWSKFPLIPYSFFFHRETATVVFNRSDAGEKMQVKKIWQLQRCFKIVDAHCSMKKLHWSFDDSQGSQECRRKRTILVVIRSEGTILAVCNAIDGFSTANDPCCQPLTRQDPCSLQCDRWIQKVRSTANDPCHQPMRRHDPCSLQYRSAGDWR